jgi:hypothetical protein
MTNVHTLYCENSNSIEVGGLKNDVTGAFVNDATVVMTLIDADLQAVSGDTFPKTMAYVADSDGVYRALLSDALALVPNARYTAVITATVSGSLIGKWRLEVLAKTRR